MVGHKCDIFVAKVASPVCVLPKRGMVWKVSFYRQTRESPVTVETNSNSFEWLLFPASFFLFWLALSLHGFLLQLDPLLSPPLGRDPWFSVCTRLLLRSSILHPDGYRILQHDWPLPVALTGNSIHHYRGNQSRSSGGFARASHAIIC